MLRDLGGVLLAVGSAPAAWMVVKVTVSISLGLMGVRLARGSRAAVRHAALAGLFAVLAMLPLAALVTPAVRIAVPVAEQDGAATVVAAEATAAIRDSARCGSGRQRWIRRRRQGRGGYRHG